MGQQVSASFVQGTMQSQGNGSGPNNPEATWWCKLLAKVVGTVAGVVAIITGIWTCVSIYPICIVAGILQMIAAFLVLVFEVPMCCTFIEKTKPISVFAQNRTYFQKALIYGGLSIIPIAMCFGLSTLFGAGLIFAAAVVYGLMALGKKADRDQMAAAARDPEMDVGSQDTKANLIENEGQRQPEPNPFAQQAQNYATQQVTQHAYTAAQGYATQSFDTQAGTGQGYR